MSSYKEIQKGYKNLDSTSSQRTNPNFYPFPNPTNEQGTKWFSLTQDVYKRFPTQREPLKRTLIKDPQPWSYLLWIPKFLSLEALLKKLNCEAYIVNSHKQNRVTIHCVRPKVHKPYSQIVSQLMQIVSRFSSRKHHAPCLWNRVTILHKHQILSQFSTKST